MNLEYLTEVLIPDEKITAYLLNVSHPAGGAKAKFFTGMGFSIEKPFGFMAALRNLALNNPVASVVETGHGIKYVVEGWLTATATVKAFVRTVWIVEPGQSQPRLVTAYPLGGMEQ